MRPGAGGHLAPGNTAGAGRTALLSACAAGLEAVVSVWLADPRSTAAVVHCQWQRLDKWGWGSARYSLVGRTLGAALLTVTADERRDTAWRRAHVLAASPV